MTRPATPAEDNHPKYATIAVARTTKPLHVVGRGVVMKDGVPRVRSMVIIQPIMTVG